MVDAVILAGGTIPEREADFREASGAHCKSLVPLLGRIMVSYVIEALKGAQGVQRVAVVGPPELQEHPDCTAADLILEESSGRSENLFLALDAFPEARRVLMVTSDTPTVTSEMFDDILEHFPPEVDLGYVVVRGETVLAKFADRLPPPPTETGLQDPNWIIMPIRDGRFTGTSSLLFNRAAIEKCRTFLKGIFDNREMGHVVRTLRPILGLPFLIRAGLALRFPALGWLVSVSEVERKLSRGLGLVARSYISPHAELAFDVDHLTDVPLAERILKERLRLNG